MLSVVRSFPSIPEQADLSGISSLPNLAHTPHHPLL